MGTQNGNMERHRVKPGVAVDLDGWDASDTSAFVGDKKDGEKAFEKLNARLEALQELLYADQRHRVLIVLQGMDTSGKDGSISHIFEGVNPIGVKVASFKRPTATELAHDYLWRVHQQTPANGEIVIFNRSHYEDVLVVRVHDLVPAERWQRRYEHITAFEKTLADEGTTILKFFLHISKDEQKQRLEERLQDPEKNWKFDKQDLEERKLWDAYQMAYEDVLSKTSTTYAPWYIVPANKKWYRNLVISSVIVDALEKLGLRYPPAPDLAGLTVT
ncbi:MAG: polyphosphate kinase 2 family protein [Myxococcota bacterium]